MNKKDLFNPIRSVFLILFFALPSLLFAKVNIPAQTAWIMDSASIIDSGTKNQLETYLESINTKSGVQIAVFTVNSIKETAGEDLTIEEYAAEVFEKWGLGQKDKDNGILLLVEMDTRSLRIEVGYGLEGVLTDTKCGLIIRNFIAPEFKNADYSAGIKTGVETIAGYATGNQEITESVDSFDSGKDENTVAAVMFLIWAAFFIFITITSIRKSRGRRPPAGGFYDDHSRHDHRGGFGGGFGGFGGGGSGGFGGGGGGHSGGGGASGGW